MKMMRNLTAALLISLRVATMAPAQNPNTGASTRLPQMPLALMQLGWQQNGLHGPGLTPWHVHATWELADAKGHPTSQGTWEMWWAGEKEYKVGVTAPGYEQTRYVTDRGTFVVGNIQPAIPIVNFVSQMLLSPVPNWTPLASVGLEILTHRAKGQKLTCTAPENEMGEMHSSTKVPQYCFSGNWPAIRLVATRGSESVFNSFVQFQGRYVARDVRIVGDKFPEFDIHVDALEPITQVKVADFTPPAGALNAPPGRISVAGDVMDGDFIGGQPPEYPPAARRDDVAGTVVLAATIEQDGSVGNLSVVSGPPELQDAAIAAVRTWHYLPYFLEGKPVSVETQVKVEFHLGRP
jgi:TonB family protein